MSKLLYLPLPTSESSNIPSAIQLVNGEIGRLRKQFFQALNDKNQELMTISEITEFNERRNRIIALAKRSAALTRAYESERRKVKEVVQVIGRPGVLAFEIGKSHVQRFVTEADSDGVPRRDQGPLSG